MVSLVMTLADLQEVVRELTEPLAQGGVTLALHPDRHRDGSEWLACRAAPAALRETEGRLTLWTFAQADLPLPAEVERALQDEDVPLRAGLGIGIGAQQGRAYGVAHCWSDSSPDFLERVLLVGPRMERLDFLHPFGERITPHWLMAQGLYSRVIGTVGLDTFGRLQRSRIALIGAGGNGSLMASHLARFMGRDGQIALIDPDRIELYNLPAWAAAGRAPAEALPGRFKAEVLADSLRALPDPPEIEAVTASVLDWSALAVLKRYDLLICCVDNPAARYAAAFFAALYLRPLLDVATGVFLGSGPEEHSRRLQQDNPRREANSDLFRSGRLPAALLEAGRRAMGADVRLIVPGRTDRAGNCLLCHGGIGDLSLARRELALPAAQRGAASGSAPFWEGRAGSLWMLNNEAVSLAMRLLLAFLGGEITGSQHWQMDETLSTPPQWRLLPARARLDCPLCKRTGYGDDAWRERDQVLSEMDTTHTGAS